MSPQNDFQIYRPITGCQWSLFVFDGDFGGFQWGNGPILNIMLENDLNMIDLVLTQLNQPWGPPWTLETLGDHWRHAWKWSFWPLNLSYGSIILKIVLWAHFTITHAMLTEISEFLKTTYSGTGYPSQTMWNQTKRSMKQLKRPTSMISHWFSVEMIQNGP